jgi:hypothetical protein
MENESNVRSEEVLGRLRDEGKISEAEYQELLASMNKPTSDTTPPAITEPQFFKAYRIRVLTYCLVIIVVALPIGFMLHLPYVWGMSIIGMIFIPIKLSRIKGSWVDKLMNKKK